MREGVFHLLDLQVLQQPAFALALSQVQAQTLLVIQWDSGVFVHYTCFKVSSSVALLLSSSLALLWMFSLKLRSSTGDGSKSVHQASK